MANLRFIDRAQALMEQGTFIDLEKVRDPAGHMAPTFVRVFWCDDHRTHHAERYVIDTEGVVNGRHAVIIWFARCEGGVATSTLYDWGIEAYATYDAGDPSTRTPAYEKVRRRFSALREEAAEERQEYLWEVATTGRDYLNLITGEARRAANRWAARRLLECANE